MMWNVIFLASYVSKPRVKDRVIEEGYKENTRRKEQNDKRRMGVLR